MTVQLLLEAVIWSPDLTFFFYLFIFSLSLDGNKSSGTGLMGAYSVISDVVCSENAGCDGEAGRVMICLSFRVSVLCQGPLLFSLWVLMMYAVFVESDTCTDCKREVHHLDSVLNLHSLTTSYFTCGSFSAQQI